jgi:transglutaminase-like putative cysteine protease
VGLVSDYYGDEHYLGRGNVLSDSVVMHVEAPRSPFVGVRYYWQARVYDEYLSDGRWKTTLTEQKSIPADSTDLELPSSENRIELSFTFKPLIGISSLYAVPTPVSFSRPVNIHYATNPDGSIDPAAYDAIPIIRPGEQYQVQSSISSVTQADLRQAGTDYPDWLKSRYLQLPGAITSRTRLLAISIAQGLNNPYDIAEAVTQYLRDNIEYSEVIDSPPQGQEPIDWFLFDYKKGFCNYYSTAEIILLRSLGIPARWAVGYAQGERAPGLAENLPPQLEEQLPANAEVGLSDYTVRQRDAHAWPEVYFPGIGWVEFEPTVSQNPIVRPSGETGASSTDNNQQDLLSSRNDFPAQPEENPPDPFASTAIAALEREQRAQRIRTAIIVVVVVLVLIGIGYLVVTWRKRRPQESQPLPVQLERGLTRIGIHPPNFLQHWARYAVLPVLTKAYLEINRALVRLGNAPAVEDTPSERATKLVRVLPQVKITTERLIQQYQIAQYSDHPANPDMAYDARAEIRTQSWLARIRSFFNDLPGAFRRKRSS